MRIYPHGWPEWLLSSCRRLKIGTHCVICAGRGLIDVDLCDSCESLLGRCLGVGEAGVYATLCLSCGGPLASLSGAGSHISAGGQASGHSLLPPGTSLQCNQCVLLQSPFTRVVVPYRYEFPVEHLIKDLKYRHRRQLARVLGSLLARSVDQLNQSSGVTHLPDCLIPVPLHSQREASRGFNQSADIARWCAHDLRLSSRVDAVIRHCDTGSLAGLSRAERQFRIMGAFRASAWVADQHVAIVDDVLTTGSTAREMARELYDSGAAKVELWVLARTSIER